MDCQFVIIADDITGAAEIAGIGHRFGFNVTIIMYSGEENIACPDNCEMLVIATDTRSMTEEEAVAETARLGGILKNIPCDRIFKKTDSALRGHIAAEARALYKTLGLRRALFIPQNPSKGRTIEKGMYYINKVPLHKTSFAHDPEFPAKTANVAQVVFQDHYGTILPLRKKVVRGTYVAEASTIEDIKHIINTLPSKVIIGGGADCFTVWLTSKGHAASHFTPFEGIKKSLALIVLGSTFDTSLPDFDNIKQQKFALCNTPSFLFYRKEPPKQWVEKLIRIYSKHDAFMLYRSRAANRGKAAAINLREGMGAAVAALLSVRTPQELIIEGGATAFSILKRTDWKSFNVSCEVAPGVIRMCPTNDSEITISLKPGSYPWGGLFKR